MFFDDNVAAGSVEDEVRHASSSSLALAGDFYGVQDDVCRGITFFPDAMPPPTGFDYYDDVSKKGGFETDLAPPASGFFPARRFQRPYAKQVASDTCSEAFPGC
mmetsp:Transcript_10615/g.19563  ORF Transcript_10615/g.19563 Transcript_10615/m.19563 type:complete len:104 (-) Transcript_10615:1158-1469(-)